MKKQDDGTMRNEEIIPTLRIVGAYVLVGSLWIYFSDAVVGRFVHDPHRITQIATYKGLLFIALTSSLLFILIWRYVSRINDKSNQIKMSQDYFKAIFNGISEAVFIHDAVTATILSVNRSAGEMFGYSCEEMVALNIDQLSSDEPHQKQHASIDRLMRAAQGEPQKFGWKCKRRDNSTFSSEVNMRAVTIGNEQCVVVTVRDITERAKLHNQLEQLAREQSTILATSNIGITLVNNRIQTWPNRAMCEIFGYNVDEMKDLEARILYQNQDDYARVGDEAYPLLAQGHVYDTELQMRRKDGSLVWIHLQGKAVNPNQPEEGSVWVFENISKRKITEESLRNSEEKFSTVFRVCPAIITIASLEDGRYIDVNDEMLAVTGYQKHEVIGHTSTELGIWLTSRDRQNYLDELEKNGFLANYESQFRMRNGEVRDFLVSSETIVVEGTVCSLNFILDISDRKRSEIEKNKLEAQLQQAQKLDSVGRLAGGIAHDFNNKLSVIQGYAQLSLRSGDRSDVQFSENLNEIIKAADHAQEITRRLLAFSRKDAAAPLKLDINLVMGEIKKTLGRMIGEQITLNLVLQDELWPVRIDPTQFDQLMTNLVINSRDAMPNGGQITIRTLNVSIDSQQGEILPGDYTQVSIKDEGCGIEEQVISHVFEPFFTTKEVGKGTGLGLSSVYGIVKQNGGYVTVQSEVGVGAEFSVYLPRMIEHPTLEVAENSETSLRGNGTVLLVEDEEAVRRITHLLLETIGYTVISAETTQKAIEICKERSADIDCVLSDVIMPEMNGKIFKNHIHNIRPDLPFIFMSGYTAKIIKESISSDDDFQFIQKPLNFEVLNEKLQQVISPDKNPKARS